jgi:hypothetical protein
MALIYVLAELLRTAFAVSGNESQNGILTRRKFTNKYAHSNKSKGAGIVNNL